MIRTACLRIVALLWAFVLLYPLQRIQHLTWFFFGIQLPVYYLLITVPTVFVVLYVFIAQRPRTSWQWAWWLFPFICLPGIFLGVDHMWAFRQWVSLWMRGLSLGAALTCLLDSHLQAERLLRWIYGVGVVACFFGLAEMTFNNNPLADHALSNPIAREMLIYNSNPLFHIPSNYSASTRPMGTQGNRIPYTACLVPFLPLALWRMQRSQKWSWGHFLITGSIFSLVLWSQVRASWLGFLVGVGSYALLIRKQHARRTVSILGGAVVFLLVGLMIPSTRTLIVTRTQSFNFQNRDIQHRLGGLSVVNALKGHWLFGVGYGNYAKVYAPYYTGPFPFLDTPDNQYLRWLIENGLIGFGGLSLFFIGITSTALKKIKRSSDVGSQDFYYAIFSGWIAIATTFLFFDGFYWIGPNITFWSLLGVLSTSLTKDTL